MFVYLLFCFIQGGEETAKIRKKAHSSTPLPLSLGQSPEDKVDFLPLREWIFLVMGSVFCFVCLFYPSFCGWSLALFPKNMRTFAPLLAFLLGGISCAACYTIYYAILRDPF